MKFSESVDYLLSLGNEVTAMKLGLENIRRLLAALGDPQKDYLKVQVAGTNGKGSVCVFLNSICLRAGIRTGMYTSPHLVSITERIQIDGSDISESDFGRLATRVRETAETLVASGELGSTPTFFEQVTAIALLAFADAKVKLAILETGLGGRLDATTAANAEIAAITRIDLDHQKYLGETLAEIAAEKAAIIREDSKVIVLRQTREAEQVIAGRCHELGVEPVWSTTDVLIKREPEIGPWLIATFVTSRTSYGNILLMSMPGKHQVENASVAVAIAEVLGDTGFDMPHAAIEAGLEQATHPGRLEWIGRYLLDGAHNPGGARALRDYLEEFVDRPVTMIYGSMNDKDSREVIGVLSPTIDKLIFTQPTNTRAVPVKQLLDVLPGEVDRAKVFTSPTPKEALDKARELAGSAGCVLVTGSLYLVGEVRALMLPYDSRKNLRFEI